MSISTERMLKAIDALAAVKGTCMDPRSLAEDVVLLAKSWSDEVDFDFAVASTVAALKLVVEGTVTPSTLHYNLDGWCSYHYQHHIGQGNKANMRIVFKREDGNVKVLGFGHRSIPSDIYERMARTR